MRCRPSRRCLPRPTRLSILKPTSGIENFQKTRPRYLLRVTSFMSLPLFEIARVLVRLDHVAWFIVNANHGIVRAAAKLSVINRIADCVWLGITTADRMAAHRRLDRRRDGLCAGGLRKRATKGLSHLPSSPDGSSCKKAPRIRSVINDGLSRQALHRSPQSQSGCSHTNQAVRLIGLESIML